MITVKAVDGNLTNVLVEDTINGNALTLVPSSIQISGNSSDPVNGNATENGFTYTFPSMNEDETITITYYANVDYSEGRDGVINWDQTQNTLTVTPENVPPPEPRTDGHIITYKKTVKGNGSAEAGTVTIDGKNYSPQEMSAFILM